MDEHDPEDGCYLWRFAHDLGEPPPSARRPLRGAVHARGDDVFDMRSPSKGPKVTTVATVKREKGGG